jgi:hypothetical protein
MQKAYVNLSAAACCSYVAPSCQLRLPDWCRVVATAAVCRLPPTRISCCLRSRRRGKHKQLQLRGPAEPRRCVCLQGAMRLSAHSTRQCIPSCRSGLCCWQAVPSMQVSSIGGMCPQAHCGESLLISGLCITCMRTQDHMNDTCDDCVRTLVWSCCCVHSGCGQAEAAAR